MEMKLDTQQKIITVTKELIEGTGYNEVTTSRIAEAAGLSVGIIYRYFPEGRDAIVRAIMKEGFTEIIDAIDITKMRRGNVSQSIHKMISHLIENHRKNEALLNAAAIAYLTNRMIFADPIYLNKNEHVKLRNILKKMKELKIISSDIEEKTIDQILSFIDGVIHYHIIFSPILKDDKHLAEFLTELIIKHSQFAGIS